MTKIRQDNDITNLTSAIYIENDIELFVAKMRYDNNVTNHIGLVYAVIENELSWPI